MNGQMVGKIAAKVKRRRARGVNKNAVSRPDQGLSAHLLDPASALKLHQQKQILTKVTSYVIRPAPDFADIIGNMRHLNATKLQKFDIAFHQGPSLVGEGMVVAASQLQLA